MDTGSCDDHIGPVRDIVYQNDLHRDIGLPERQHFIQGQRGRFQATIAKGADHLAGGGILNQPDVLPQCMLLTGQVQGFIAGPEIGTDAQQLLVFRLTGTE